MPSRIFQLHHRLEPRHWKRQWCRCLNEQCSVLGLVRAHGPWCIAERSSLQRSRWSTAKWWASVGETAHQCSACCSCTSPPWKGGHLHWWSTLEVLAPSTCQIPWGSQGQTVHPRMFEVSWPHHKSSREPSPCDEVGVALALSSSSSKSFPKECRGVPSIPFQVYTCRCHLGPPDGLRVDESRGHIWCLWGIAPLSPSFQRPQKFFPFQRTTPSSLLHVDHGSSDPWTKWRPQRHQRSDQPPSQQQHWRWPENMPSEHCWGPSHDPWSWSP